ncbi:hypothetical protein SNEBB_001505 [Seison nebaliae]|nr:hypothetical protein SNEBB_001505 [Seison nebaliae]
MGRKKRREPKPWCWYCNREFDDTKILTQHQKARHFKCAFCNKKLYTGPGLQIHCIQVHKEKIERVPNATRGRDDISLEIFGMNGIPDADLLAHNAELEGLYQAKRQLMSVTESSSNNDDIPIPSISAPFPNVPLADIPVPPPPAVTTIPLISKYNNIITQPNNISTSTTLMYKSQDQPNQKLFILPTSFTPINNQPPPPTTTTLINNNNNNNNNLSSNNGGWKEMVVPSDHTTTLQLPSLQIEIGKSSKLFHPPFDISLEEFRAHLPNYSKRNQNFDNTSKKKFLFINPIRDYSPNSSHQMESVPWIEKYRPIQINDILGHKEIIDRFKIFAQNGNIPNILLAGPPGVGKTTSIHCLARELLKEYYPQAVLELNASNERGIDVVRNRIKSFATRLMKLPETCHKIIILDEADSMTEAAQQALRRIMEMNSSTTRFALAANTSSKIIEAIQSRCVFIRFRRLEEMEMINRLKEIMKAENVSCSVEGLNAIIQSSEGDMRQAINNLQSTYFGFGVVTATNVYKVCDEAHPILLKRILRQSSTNIHQALLETEELLKDGYSPSDILIQLSKIIYRMDDSRFMEDKENGPQKYDELIHLKYIEQLAEVQVANAQGHITPLQLRAFLCRLSKISK